MTALLIQMQAARKLSGADAERSAAQHANVRGLRDIGSLIPAGDAAVLLILKLGRLKE